MLARELRTPRERKLFAIAATFSSIVWLVLMISVIGFAAAALVGLIALFAHRLFMARVVGNGVRVGPRQLRDLMRRIEAAAHKLGMDRVPQAYVLQARGRLNAFATKIFSRRFIIIRSELLDAADTGDGSDAPSDLDFMIGHEMGRHATGQLDRHLFLLPARILPWLGPAYARACAYTCDRCGHAVTGDLAVSSRALAILAAGPHAGRRLDLDAYVDQRRDTGRFWMAVHELNARHPFLSKRVAALRAWQDHRALEPAKRHPLSYPLAPLFGVMSGGPQSAFLILVAVAGIAAALAVPRLKELRAGRGGPSDGYKFEPGDRSLDPLPPLPGDRAP